MKIVTTHEAKTHLSALLQEVGRGETIVISRGKKPMAKLVPYEETPKKPRPKVGETMDEPCKISDDALRPLNEGELCELGIL